MTLLAAIAIALFSIANLGLLITNWMQRQWRLEVQAKLKEFRLVRLRNAPKSPEPNAPELKVVGKPFAESHSYLWVRTILPNGDDGYIALTTHQWNIARARAMKQDEDLLYWGQLAFENQMIVYEQKGLDFSSLSDALDPDSEPDPA